jgi:precorrin-6Y C5,15-methyltransferase (decarboxylating)
MTPIQVVGIGLDGAAGLAPGVQAIVRRATVLVGSDRHLAYFPESELGGDRWRLGDLGTLATRLQTWLADHSGETDAVLVVLVSGDPLFFGLGRWLLEVCPPEVLTFHPHPSAVQLAFSRVKLPWQGATVVSLHGRASDRLITALKRGDSPIAVLTDGVNTPGAIARLVQDLALPQSYRLWVCENLGGATERVQAYRLSELAHRDLAPLNVAPLNFAPLNIVILQAVATPPPPAPPRIGIEDGAFLGFSDRPGLMTKREVRLLALGELALQPSQVVWDVGAGTGSVSIEVARLVPDSQVFAIEKTAVGVALIRQNAERFATPQVQAIHGSAPAALGDLPDPDRVFIGGSGGNLAAILTACGDRLRPGGRLVCAIATLEHSATLTQWLADHPQWRSRACQVQLARSVAVGPLTRWSPLNPVTLTTLEPHTSPDPP